MEKNLRTSDFHYYLPQECIAQKPLQQRDQSRLLHLGRATGTIAHHLFHNIVSILNPGDRLVFNDTKVVPARLYCKKETGGTVELLFIRKTDDLRWCAWVKPARRVKEGMILTVEDNPSVALQVGPCIENNSRSISLHNNNTHSIESILQQYGKMPLPPYIKREAGSEDSSAYQTVYARNIGAIAAPTAGLHFTDTCLDMLKRKGIDFSYVTLHVGIGTFRPVTDDDPRQHHMHKEEYYLSKKTVDEIMETKQRMGRIVAVGTTTVRVLEHCAASGILTQSHGTTALMIMPGFRFSVIDGLITNFHLPCSTLLMLVSAFGGKERVMNAYQEAITMRYRFYSYGDAMLII